jgi:hypothetical protein
VPAGVVSEAVTQGAKLRGVVVQSFSQADFGTKAKADSKNGAASVLLSFQVEQNGNEMKIIDHDGSVYTGSWHLADTLPRVRSPKSEDSSSSKLQVEPERKSGEKVSATLQDTGSQAFLFTVAGTNRSLKQRVVFTGNVQTIPGQRPAANLQTTAGAGAKPAENRADGALPLVNSQISGRAVIGGRRTVEINAVPTPTRQ